MTHNPTDIFLTAAHRSQQLGLPETSTWKDIQNHSLGLRSAEVKANAENAGLAVAAPKCAQEIYELNCKIAKSGQKLKC